MACSAHFGEAYGRSAAIGFDKAILAGKRQCLWLRKVHDDLSAMGETCGKNRVSRLMQLEGLRSQTGYKHRPGKSGGKPSVVSPNRLQQQFDVSVPNQAWVTDITYIRTYEGWLYLAVAVQYWVRPYI